MGAGARVSSPPAENAAVALEHAGGKMVVELVGAFNELTERMKSGVSLSTRSSRILFKALKLAIPMLQSSPLGPDGRPPLSRALSVAIILADLQVLENFSSWLCVLMIVIELGILYFKLLLVHL